MDNSLITFSNQYMNQSNYQGKNNSYMNMQDILIEIQKNISILQDNSTHPNFLKAKLSIGSEALRECNINHVGFNVQIPSTVFGEIYEKFTFKFDLEGYSDSKKIKNIPLIEPEIMEDNQEEIFDSRMYSLYGDNTLIEGIFNIITSQLNSFDLDFSISLTALAIYEIESLSKHRYKNSLLCQQMYNLDNPSDQWMALLNVKACYTKPTFKMIPTLMH